MTQHLMDNLLPTLHPLCDLDTWQRLQDLLSGLPQEQHRAFLERVYANGARNRNHRVTMPDLDEALGVPDTIALSAKRPAPKRRRRPAPAGTPPADKTGSAAAVDQVDQVDPDTPPE